MSVGSRIVLLAVVAGVCLAVHQWELTTTQPPEMTRAALRQFDNSDAAAQELRVADAGKQWWVVGSVGALLVLAVCLFKEDVERAFHGTTEQS